MGADLEGAKLDEDTDFSNAKVAPDDFEDLDLSILDRKNLLEALWTSVFVR